jgi:pSer/pThr/pTyr-binding forkhead associated (FHA) protein
VGKLVVFLADGTTHEVILEKERVTIGRRADNDVCLPFPAVSGEHATVVTILADSFLEDLGSTNGTLVNGKPIAKHFLRDHDLIDIGRQKLTYLSDNSASVEPLMADIIHRELPGLRDRVSRATPRPADAARAPDAWARRLESANTQTPESNSIRGPESPPLARAPSPPLRATQSAPSPPPPPERYPDRPFVAPKDSLRMPRPLPSIAPVVRPSKASPAENDELLADLDSTAELEIRGADLSQQSSATLDTTGPLPLPRDAKSPETSTSLREPCWALKVLSGPSAGIEMPIVKDEVKVGRIGVQVAAIRVVDDHLQLVAVEGPGQLLLRGAVVPPAGVPIAAGDQFDIAGAQLMVVRR